MEDAGRQGKRPDPRHIATPTAFGEALTWLREQAGLSVREVGKRTGLETSTLGGYFSGRHLPPTSRADVLVKIMDACGITDLTEVKNWQDALVRVRRVPGRRPADAPVPYRGLKSYEPQHADWFFGREKLTIALVRLLAERYVCGGVVVVVGPSGSGKSSLLRAGLIAALVGGDVDVPGSKDWPWLAFAPGEHPLRELAAQFAAKIGTSAEILYEELRSNPAICADLARQVCVPSDDSDHPAAEESDHCLVLVVDQFEEVFAPGVDEIERSAFIAALNAAGTQTELATTDNHVRSPAAVVVLGLRADFYSHAARWPALVDALQHRQVVVGPMSKEELRVAITEPAIKAKCELEDGLVELLLRDLQPATSGAPSAVAHEAGALPLLSHALLATYTARSGRRMTVAAYNASGGISGGVACTAEEVYDELEDAQKETARQLLLRLVHVGQGIPDTRRKVSCAELIGEDSAESQQRNEVLNRFVQRRLITVDDDWAGITHEALLTAWPRLKDWIDADRAGLVMHRQLTEAARGWQETNQDSDILLRGGQLAGARGWADDPMHQGSLTQLERDYLKASIIVEHRRVLRRRQVLVVLSVLVLLSGTLAGYAFVQRNTALDQRDRAVSSQLAAEANRLRGNDPTLAAQLALIAYRLAPTAETRSSLLASYTGPSVTRLLSPSGVPQRVAFTGDGQIMATGDADPTGTNTTLRLWSIAERRKPTLLSAPIVGHSGSTWVLVFSPDGQTLVSSGADQTIRLWNVSDPTMPTPLGDPIGGPTDKVYSLAYSADGEILAVGSADNTIWIYDVADPRHPIPLGRPLTGPAGDVQSVAFSPNGNLLAIGSADHTVWLWNLTDPMKPTLVGEPISDPSSVLHVAFSPDGKTLAVAASGAEKSVRLWNVTTPERPVLLGEPLTGPAGLVNFVGFSPDGRTLAAACSDNKVWVWNLATRRTLAILPHPVPATMVRFLDNDQTLISAAEDGVIRLWTLPGPVITDPKDTVFTAAIGSDGHSLLVGADGADRTVRLWNLADPRRPIPLSPPMSAPTGRGLSGAAAQSPDRRTVAAGTLDGPVYLWDASDPRQPVLLSDALLGATKNIESVAFSPDGKALAVASDDNDLRLWDVTDPRRPFTLAVLDEPAEELYATAFSPDGRFLAAGSGEKKAWLWDISNREHPIRLSEPLTGFSQEVYSVAFSPDGRTLAAGSADKTIRLWDISNPLQPTPLGAPLTGPNNIIYWLTFSPDGQTLAAGGGDGTVWLWNLNDRNQPSTYATLTGFSDAVWTVSFSPDGQTLAAGGADRIVRLWKTDPDQVASYICAIVGDPITREEWERYLPGLPYDQPCPLNR